MPITLLIEVLNFYSVPCHLNCVDNYALWAVYLVCSRLFSGQRVQCIKKLKTKVTF